MKKVSNTAIGAFVLFAIALAVLCVMLFGSGHLFQTNITYTLSFDKSVKGLAKGAPVMFRGIKIGEVTDIKLSFNSPNLHATNGNIHSWPISVTVKLFPNSVAFADNRESWFERTADKINPISSSYAMESWLQDMILQKGLRAQLQNQNFITGLLFIELDLFPNEQPTDILKEMVAKRIIPTRMSAFEQLFLTLNQNNMTSQVNKMIKLLDNVGKLFADGKVETIVENLTDASTTLNRTMSTIDEFADNLKGFGGKSTIFMVASLATAIQKLNLILDKFNQERTDRLLDNADQTLLGIRKTVDTINQQVPEILGSANDSLQQFNDSTKQLTPKLDATLTSAQKLMDNVDGVVTKNAPTLAQTLQKLNATLDQLDKATAEGHAVIANARKTLDPDSQLLSDLSKAIQDAQQAAQSIRSLADMLTNTPEALIRGR